MWSFAEGAETLRWADCFGHLLLAHAKPPPALPNPISNMHVDWIGRVDIEVGAPFAASLHADLYSYRVAPSS